MSALQMQAEQLAKEKRIPLQTACEIVARQNVLSEFEAENGLGFQHSAEQLAKKEGIPLSRAMEKLAAENPDSYNRHVERMRSTPRAPAPRERVKS